MISSVLFIVFNRPDTTRQVFEAIRAAKPPRLYIASDGPRAGRAGEHALCEQVQQVLTDVDWPCKVQRLIRKENLGCKLGVSSAIDWFFENEEEGIILEDDVLPLPSFFNFCDELLDRYRTNEKITMISGCNLVSKRYRPSESYFFSRYCHIWGWATWRRAWKNYDVSMTDWPNWCANDGLSEFVNLTPQLAEFWKKIFDAVHSGKVDTWDYQWVFSCWKTGGLSVIPETNLTSNIGFRADATHTVMEIPPCVLESSPQDLGFPLVAPRDVLRGKLADSIIERFVFGHHS